MFIKALHLNRTCLFSFINDTQDCLDNGMTSVIYANITLLISDEDNNKLLTKCNFNLEKLRKWFNNNRLNLNNSKTNFLRFHNYQKQVNSNIDIKINEVFIQNENCVNILRIWLDDTLKWKQHCLHVMSKLSFTLFNTQSWINTILESAIILSRQRRIFLNLLSDMQYICLF